MKSEPFNLQKAQALLEQYSKAAINFLPLKSLVAIVLGIGIPLFLAWRITVYTDEQKLQNQKKEMEIAKAKEDSLVQRQKMIGMPPTPEAENSSPTQRRSNGGQASITSLAPEAQTIFPQDTPTPPGNKTTYADSRKALEKARLTDFEVTGGVVTATLIFLIILYVFYKKQSDLKAEWDKDRDPDELKKLFNDFEDTIIALGTPRKIKRFFNKVRVQYNLLNTQKQLKQNERSIFMKSLLHIEQNRNIVSADTYKEFLQEFVLSKRGTVLSEPRKLTWAELQVEIEKDPDINKHQKLLERLFELNRDVIV